MSQIYNINRLSAIFSEKTGHKSDASLSIIMEIFHTVADGLKESGSVKIKGFGEFTVDAGGQVVFYSDESLEERINEPFSIFEPIEIEPELTSALTEEDLPAEETPETKTETETDKTENIGEHCSQPHDTALEIDIEQECVENIESATTDLNKKVTEAEQRADRAERLSNDMKMRLEEAEKSIEESRRRAAEAERKAIEARRQADDKAKRAEEYAQRIKYMPVQNDSGRSVLMFLLGLCVGIILGGAAVYFIPFLMK